MATKQLEILDFAEKDQEPDKEKWDKDPGFWKRWIKQTREEHICQRCNLVIPKGSRAQITLEFNGVKPEPEDFRNIRYWHADPRCHDLPPDLPIEDEPLP